MYLLSEFRAVGSFSIHFFERPQNIAARLDDGHKNAENLSRQVCRQWQTTPVSAAVRYSARKVHCKIKDAS
jgi:hypothetical protein